MPLPVKLDHCVVHVSDWDRSNAFYSTVMGAELVKRTNGWAYRFGATTSNDPMDFYAWRYWSKSGPTSRGSRS